MNVPTDLEPLGRAFLAALVARLGHDGAAGVLMLLAVQIKMPGQREPLDMSDPLNRND